MLIKKPKKKMGLSILLFPKIQKKISNVGLKKRDKFVSFFFSFLFSC